MNFREIKKPDGSVATDAILREDSNGNTVYIPEGGIGWAEYLEWLAAGNQPLTAQ